MYNILIADDHAIVREGLKQILAEESDMIVSGEASDSEQLFSLLSNKKWDVLVLDINMPGKSGLDSLKDIKIQYPGLPVLILSMFSEEQYGMRALKAGASGYLKKVSAPTDLVLAIRTVLSGKKFVSQGLAQNLASNLNNEKKSLTHSKLSDREYSIMCEIASGKSAEQIAKDISISIHTVYTYRNRILDKLKLKSNVELTQYAIKNNLIDI